MKPAQVDRIRFVHALQSRPFALLWIGQTLSVLGSGALTTLLSWQVLLLTHSASATGLVLAVNVIANVLFLLPGGVAADYLPRHRIILWSSIGQAFIVLLIAGLSWWNLLQFWHILVVVIAFGILEAFGKPGYLAIVPQLVEKTALSSANTLTELSNQMGILLGPLLGVVCISMTGVAGAFACDGLAFVCSAGSLLVLHSFVMPQASSLSMLENDLLEKQTTRTLQQTFSVSQKVQSVVADISDGLRYVFHSTWLWVTLIVVTLVNIGLTGPLETALPKLILDSYKADVRLIGALGTANAVGAIVGSILAGQLLHRFRRHGLLAYLAIIVSGIAVVALGLPLPQESELIVSVIASAFVGLGFSFFGVIWVTVMQELVPSEKLGRVNSIGICASFSLIPIGYAITGVLTDNIGPGKVFIIGGLFVSIVASLGLFVPDIRRLTLSAPELHLWQQQTHPLPLGVTEFLQPQQGTLQRPIHSDLPGTDGFEQRQQVVSEPRKAHRVRIFHKIHLVQSQRGTLQGPLPTHLRGTDGLEQRQQVVSEPRKAHGARIAHKIHLVHLCSGGLYLPTYLSPHAQQIDLSKSNDDTIKIDSQQQQH